MSISTEKLSNFEQLQLREKKSCNSLLGFILKGEVPTLIPVSWFFIKIFLLHVQGEEAKQFYSENCASFNRLYEPRELFLVSKITIDLKIPVSPLQMTAEKLMYDFF